MRPALFVRVVCLLSITAFGVTPCSRAAEQQKAEPEEKVVPAEKTEATEKEEESADTLRMDILVVPSPDETMEVKATKMIHPISGGDFLYRFVLQGKGHWNDDGTIVRFRTAGGKWPTVTIKWSPDSRYVALMHSTVPGTSLVVYDCQGEKPVEVPLPLNEIEEEVEKEMKAYLKGKKILEPNYRFFYVLEEGVRWTPDGGMVVTIEGGMTEPLDTFLKAEYEAKAKDGHAVRISWDMHAPK